MGLILQVMPGSFVTIVIEEILNVAIDISQKKFEHDTLNYKMFWLKSGKKQTKTKSLNCPVCKKLFKNEIILNQHMRMFHEIAMKDEVMTPCPNCQQVFWSDEPKAFCLPQVKNHCLKRIAR